jgi:type IV pilus assembly protein PilA
MALNNIKKMRKDSCFTIVELLIVIVVIAILATISIVAYSGIQTRAKETKAQANASQVQKVAEAYYADNSVYPTTTAMFNNAVTKLPASVSILTNASATTITALSATNGENSVMYRYVTGALGACVFYWDFSSSALSTAIYLGTGSAANCSGTVGTTGNTPTS